MIANADAARIPLPDKSVHAVITSPPYFGPRKYKGKKQLRDWPAVSYSPMPGLPPLEVPAMRCELGREATPEFYIAHLVLCFREVFRVLRDDGTCWVVEGDSYAGSGDRSSGGKGYEHMQGKTSKAPDKSINLKQGDLLAIPYRLLLALQADGWLVRNDVVWSKVAPMPESVSGTKWERHQIKVREVRNRETDTYEPAAGRNDSREGRGVYSTPWNEYTDCPGCPRCSATGGYVLRRGSWRHTRSHETVLMLVKSMQYFSDQERVREKYNPNSLARYDYEFNPDTPSNLATDNPSTKGGKIDPNPAGRNPRDVLTPAPSPFKGEHYAAFPPDLIRPLILSSAPLKCCPVCGAGWAAVVEQHEIQFRPNSSSNRGQESYQQAYDYPQRAAMGLSSNVTGYRPTCACLPANGHNEYTSGLVLDPFCGSGTTGLVCRELGLRFVGLDISGEYLRDIALVRSERLTPDSAMVNLPLFELLQS